LLAGWSVEIQSDPRGVEGMAQQLKSGGKAYPLFNLAGLVLERPERFRASFKKSAETAEALFQVKLDGSLWLSERDAVAHVLARHRDRYYLTETVPIDPPKGAFGFIAVCGMSGTVLGPPNFHDYVPRLMRLHAERFAHMPFDVFKSRIRMEKDEALIEKWKQEQSVQEVYVPVERPARGTAAPAADAAQSAVPEEAAPEQTVVSAPEPVVPPGEASDGGAPAAAPVAEIPAQPGLKLSTRAELEAHFRQHHAVRIIAEVREKAAVPGPVALQSSAGPVAARVRRMWEELRRFPLPLAQRLGQQFASRGLHLFKAHGRVTYVTPARPRHLDVESTPVDDGIKGILEYLQAHPKAPRADQWLGLVALRTSLPEAEREAALAKDLLWLIREGHVIDFAGGRLEAARKPKPAPAPQTPASAAPPAPDSAEAGSGTTDPSAPTPAEASLGEDEAIDVLPEADGSLPGDDDEADAENPAAS
jgi:hypothetical protein